MAFDAAKTISICAVAFLGAGCMINPRYLPEQYSFTRLSGPRYDFGIDIYSGKLEELDGPGSPKVDALIKSEVQKAGICPNGYVVSDHGYMQGGYRSLAGKCK